MAVWKLIEEVIIGAVLLLIIILVFANPLKGMGNNVVDGAKQLMGIGDKHLDGSGIYAKQDSTVDSSTSVCTKTETTKPGVKVNIDYFGQLQCSSRATSISMIVLHHTGDTSAKTTINTLKTEGYSVHYIVDKDGTIYYLIDESKKAWHTGCRAEGQGSPVCISEPPVATNDNSIGIEIVNLGSSSDQYTSAQYTALGSLLRDITSRNSIPYDNGHIVAHYEITQEKWDPSPNFDWQQIGLYGHIPLSSFGTAPSIAGYS